MPGCLSYIVAKDTIDTNAIWITEAWDSKVSHEASLSLPSVKEAIAKGRPLIAGFSDRVVTTPVGGTGLALPDAHDRRWAKFKVHDADASSEPGCSSDQKQSCPDGTRDALTGRCRSWTIAPPLAADTRANFIQAGHASVPPVVCLAIVTQ